MGSAVAEYDAIRERMTVYASTQVPYYVHLMLAQILDMDMSRIRVIKPHVGGGFRALLGKRAGHAETSFGSVTATTTFGRSGAGSRSASVSSS